MSKTQDKQEKQTKVQIGRVVSDKMDKTIVVAIERKVRHKLYGKTMKKVSRIKAHDGNNSSKQGDLVEITEARPLSATKKWRLTKIIEKA